MSSYFVEILNTEKKKSWAYIQDICWSRANYISFNVLFKNEDYLNFETHLKEDLVPFDNTLKLYASGEFIKLRKSEKLRNIFLNFSFDDFLNTCLEDISFWDEKSEFIATITHEDCVIVRDDFLQYIASEILPFEEQ